MNDDSIFIKKVSVAHALEDGMTVQADVDLFFRPSQMLFHIPLPKYLDETAQCEDIGNVGDTGKEAIERYELIADHYSRAKLVGGPGVRKLMLNPDIAMFHYRRYYAYNDGRFREANSAWEIVSRPVNPEHLVGLVLVPWSAEVEAKLQEIDQSIHRAAAILNGIVDAADPASYILAIQFGGQADQPKSSVADTPAAFEPVSVSQETAEAPRSGTGGVKAALFTNDTDL